jgi:predicted DNA-binding ribbon-helix-helix protein
LRNRWLVQHKSSGEEIANLFALSDRDLAACQTKNLPADWRFAIAYNAALQAATAALAAAGYRAGRESHHHRVIQSLEFTLAPERKLIDTFDKFRKKRNISSYNIAGSVSEKEAHEMYELASALRARVERWVRKNHPKLLAHTPHP